MVDYRITKNHDGDIPANTSHPSRALLLPGRETSFVKTLTALGFAPNELGERCMRHGFGTDRTFSVYCTTSDVAC